MITFVRTNSIAPGELAKAVGFAKEIAAFVEKIIGHKVGVSIPVGGNRFRVAWVVALPDLGALEASFNKLQSNPEYMNRMEAAGGYFLPGAARDEIWSSL
jgi:hypothetical protein